MEPQDQRNGESQEAPPIPPVQTRSARRATLGRRRNAMRVLRDQDRQLVVVYELVDVNTADPPMLVFEWGKSQVKLRQFPENWRDLKDAALLALRTPPS